MTRLVTSGFEIYATPTPSSGDTTALKEAGAPDGYGQPFGTISRVTTGQRSGAGCGRAQSGAFFTFPFTGALDRGYWLRAYLKVGAVGTGNMTVLSYASSGGNQTGAVLNTDGTISAFNSSGVKSAAVNDGAWHRLEYFFKCSATQASRAWELRVDGATLSSGTNQTTETLAPIQLNAGCVTGSSGDVSLDDLAVNDDQGAAPHNTWPGAGYVICLLPTADNSRGTWTGGAGGTTSLFDALNNTPPTGATAPGTNLSQISANAVATTALFDTQTYLAAGAASGDTALGCVVVTATGEQVATGTKSGHADTVNTVNNTPTATTGTLNFSLDTGAEAAWPVFWRWWASPFTVYSAQPALSSGARLGITTTTVSRVADACFLGLIVELQPAAAPAATKKPRVLSTNVPAMRAALR